MVLSSAPSSPLRVRSEDGVQAVVAARGYSDALAETLRSVIEQDIEHLDVLVVGSMLAAGSGEGSLDELSAGVANLVPDAVVVAVDEPGLSAAYNAVLDRDVDAPFVLLLTDDTALEAEAVQHLIAESRASSAAVVGPKLVERERPRVLVEVGLGADKFAHPVSAVEPDELDQEQHDAVADVFAVPSCCALVRTELFGQIDGFDPDIPIEGEDIDFGWRALLAGARIVVAPDAVARHQPGGAARWSSVELSTLRPRHQVRTVLGGYGRVRLARVVPQMVALWVVEIVGLAATLQFGRIRKLIGAWTWNLRRLRSANRKRRTLTSYRTIHDGELRDYQERGSAKVSRFLSTHFVNEDGDSSLAAARQSLAAKLSTGELRNALIAMGAIVAVLIFGSRQLIRGGVPAFGEFASYGDPRLLFTEWWSGWWRSGLGTDAQAPAGNAAFGLLGYAFFGATGFVRQVAILGLLPAGLAGMWRLAGPLRSRRAQVAGVIAYAALPVPYNAISVGSWSTLALYASLPWALNLALRVARDTPFPREIARPTLVRAVGRLGLVVAIAAWITPLVVPAVLLMVSGIVVGSLIAGSMRGVSALVAVTAVGVAVAVALHLPSLLWLDSWQWATFGGAGDTEPGSIPFVSLLRFHTGSFSDTPIVWALLGAPVFALLVGRGWRLVWAVRAWFVAIAGWAVAWAAEWGALPVPLPAIEMPLAVAGVGIAFASALAVSAFEHDLGRNKFGWRQVGAIGAGLSIVLATLPLLAGSIDGKWHSPDRGFSDMYRQLFDETVDEATGEAETEPVAEGDYRVLWIGEPGLLPVEGWPLAGNTAFALTEGGLPTLTDLHVAPVNSATIRVKNAIEDASQRRSGRLGAALAPMGIRYVVVTLADAPAPFARRTAAIDPATAEGLAEQLDLVRLSGVNGSIRLYENESWFPTIAAIAPGVDRVPEPSSAPPLLPERPSANRFVGPYSPGTDIHTATARNSGWRLEIGGSPAARSVGFDWANQFTPTEQGEAVLFYRTPPVRRIVLIAQLAGWLVLMLAMWVRRSR